MKNRNILGLIVAMAVTGGCAKSSELIKTSGISTRTDVFRELADGGPVPKGYADLRIVSSLKTHKQGMHQPDEKSHGTPAYRLLVSIDGQATEISGALREENIEPRGIRDPEAGEGIRYLFRKGLRLKAGTHRLAVAIPEDEIVVEEEISLAEGSSNSLVVEPIYAATAPQGGATYYSPTSFLGGVRWLRMVLNGK